MNPIGWIYLIRLASLSLIDHLMCSYRQRALSFWFPMEDAIIDNGCMWFIAGSHKEGLRNHRPVTEGHHVRMTDDVNPDLATPCPVQAGGCTIHTGNILVDRIELIICS